MHARNTELILFGSINKLNKVKDFKADFQGHSIQGQKWQNILDASYLDNDLSCKCMVETTVKKASSRISFLYKHKNCLDQNSRKRLGNALVQCHLDYCY